MVQGTSVIRSFNTSYGSSSYAEANFAVSNVVTTNGVGSQYVPALLASTR